MFLFVVAGLFGGPCFLATSDEVALDCLEDCRVFADMTSRLPSVANVSEWFDVLAVGLIFVQLESETELPKSMDAVVQERQRLAEVCMGP